ncbi:MAG: hypothetical protein KAJ18_12630 [Candidatus Omnitrophica bacterium]|nr:hypothetical protein [Candidatus Omnitrophota bacterium]
MGVSELANKLVSAAIQGPRIFGIASIFLRQGYKGNSIADDLQNFDIKGALIDAREIVGGIDDDGNFQPEWLKTTWKPVIVGDLATRGLQLIRRVIREVV